LQRKRKRKTDFQLFAKKGEKDFTSWSSSSSNDKVPEMMKIALPTLTAQID